MAAVMLITEAYENCSRRQINARKMDSVWTPNVGRLTLILIDSANVARPVRFARHYMASWWLHQVELV